MWRSTNVRISSPERHCLDTVAPCPFSNAYPNTGKDLICIQTLAGVEKILGRKGLTLEELRRTFYDNRRDFEAMANLLYEVEGGEVLTITVAPASDLDQNERVDVQWRASAYRTPPSRGLRVSQ